MFLSALLLSFLLLFLYLNEKRPLQTKILIWISIRRGHTFTRTLFKKQWAGITCHKCTTWLCLINVYIYFLWFTIFMILFPSVRCSVINEWQWLHKPLDFPLLWTFTFIGLKHEGQRTNAWLIVTITPPMSHKASKTTEKFIIWMCGNVFIYYLLCFFDADI